MTDAIEEIKKKLDIVSFISQYIPLQKSGRNFKANCPFHSEKTPSFMVSPERQIWKCFGCSKGGDAIRFLMEWDSLEFGEALRELAKRTGIELPAYKPTDGERQKTLLYEINHLASEYFYYLLTEHAVGKKALEYILGRGINKESIELFKIGYSPELWDGLGKFLTEKKKYRQEDIERAGLIILNSKFSIRNSRYYDRFRNRLMFPLKDHRGNVCGFSGRILGTQDGGLPADRQAKYVNSPETAIYHKSNLLYGLSETQRDIKDADGVILVEGELDMISSYQAGIKNVVAIKGSAITQSQVKLLGRFTKNITIGLDKDVAGDMAARRGIEIADKEEMFIKIVEVQGGKDPDEVAQKNPELWKKLVSEAVPVYDYYLDSAFNRFDGKTIVGKRKIGQELIPILARISDEITKSVYVGKLAERLGVDESSVAREVAKTEGQVGSVSSNTGIGAMMDKINRRELMEEFLLAACLQKEKWEQLTEKKVASLIKTPKYAKITEALGVYLKDHKTYKSERLAKNIPAEILPAFDKLFLLDLGGFLEEDEHFQKEIDKIIVRLEELDLRQKLEVLTEEIKKIEARTESDEAEATRLDALTEKYRDLSQRLTKVKKKVEKLAFHV